MISENNLGPATEIRPISEERPVLGYREWMVHSGSFRSVGVEGRWENEPAHCKKGFHNHQEAPAKGCSCGYWAFDSIRTQECARQYAMATFGVAALWGRIFFHGRHGLYRAQYARPIAVVGAARIAGVLSFRSRRELKEWVDSSTWRADYETREEMERRMATVKEFRVFRRFPPNEYFSVDTSVAGMNIEEAKERYLDGKGHDLSEGEKIIFQTGDALWEFVTKVGGVELRSVRNADPR